jgi:bifunctional enzyme CysN/CysC
MQPREQDLIERDIEAYLARQERKELLRFLTCGSVDDGKSTLIGRLLHDTKLIYEDQLAALHRESASSGSAGGELDLALLVDGLQAEREQGITIDVAYRYFSTEKRKFIIADTPGHEQYTRNMATGASTCDLAVILIDARLGVLPQTRRHSFIVSLLGIRHVVVAVNKMDLVGFDAEVFERIRREYLEFAARLDIQDIRFIPISALKGDNVVEPSRNMPWYDQGPLLSYLETVHIGSDRNMIDLRFPVQYVIRPDLHFRGFAGTVASGLLRPGDEICVLPAGTRSRVREISAFEGKLDEAFPPLAVSVTLEDEIDASRGDMLVHPGNQPRVAREFEAMLVWMAEAALAPGRPYFFKHTTNLVGGTISHIRYRVDVNSLHREPAEQLRLNEVGRVRVALHRAIPFDAYRKNRSTGAFVVIDRLTNNTVGAGMIVDREPGTAAGSFWEAEASELLEAQTSRVTPEEREQRWSQRPATLLLTGLTGAGKSSIAWALERRLFDAGRTAVVLDGENLRLGISRDLGFSAAERSENMRRAAELARLLNDSGLLCIVALSAPEAAVRERARARVGADQFVEIHVDAPLEVCRQRAPQMYARAQSGEIEGFPGVSSPYEAPRNPALVLRTDQLAVDACVDRIMRLLEQRGLINP